MSGRHISQTRNDYKSSLQPQKKFVPKTDFQKLNTRQTTLSSSLRDDSSASADRGSGKDAEISSTGRVTMGDNGEWASKSSATGRFVIYLPQDEAVAAGLRADEGGLDPVESQHVVDLLNRELSRLLKLGPKQFWREVSTDESLYAFLESFLKFRSRWYDFPHNGVQGIVAGVIVDEFELCRRVFMVLYRLSSNRDPGAKAADTLSSKDHAVLLQSKKLLDLPKLLDICAIYGQENEDLTRRLVMNAMKAQPHLQYDFPVLMSNFLSIVRTMYQRCDSTLKDLLGSGDSKDQGSRRLRFDFLEFMDFINDAVVSLDSFINAYKQASVFFASPAEMSDGNEELLMTLARLHDSLLPSLQKGFHVIFGSAENRNPEISRDMLPNFFISLKMLYTRIVTFGWKLLYFCYLSDDAFESSCSPPVLLKMFPANVEDPVVRSDILIQSLKDLSGFHSFVSEERSRETFIQNIEKDHRIMSRIQLLQQTGWISMDNEQFQFLVGIMKHPLETATKLKSSTPALSISKATRTDENAAILESKISQIKELFPDYGRGFSIACLEVYNQDAEEVIQRILEGTLHEELQSLDTKLERIPSPKAVPSMSRDKGKGKGKLVESVDSPSEVVASTLLKTAGVSSSSSSTLFGRFIRKNADDVSNFETLDAKDKELAKTAVLMSQLEYEDEYDDSFDDLGLSICDSVLEESEELEGKMASQRGSTQADGGGSTSDSDNSKWGSRKKPLFYVKDGKNYSYKVEGSVAVANYNEAKLLNQAQKELIHGLGRGGNIPLGSVKKLEELNEQQINGQATDEVEEQVRGGRGTVRGRGKRSFSSGAVKKVSESNEEQNAGLDTDEVGGRRGRGGGRRGGGRNHNRQDRAMKKYFSGMPGHYNT